MNITLRNSQLELAISSKGAELQGVTDCQDQTQYLWQADPAYWGRHAPVLFPIVGRLKNDQYQWRGRTYAMKQHGFARDQEFSLLQQEAHRASFELTPNESTRSQYPFAFCFQIHYLLSERELSVAYEVRHQGRGIMPFTLGAHPAFCCPLVEGEQLTDYEVRFQTEEQAERHLLTDGLFDGRSRQVLQGQARLPLDEHTFEEDALVFHHLKSNWVALHSRVSGRKVQLFFEGFPFLGIWAKPGAPFVCLEPWHGLADEANASGNLEEKVGMRLLQEGQTFQTSYRILFD